MLLKAKISPEKRAQFLISLGSLAGLAFVLSVFLGRLENPDLDFITGFLAGLSVVGNLVFIYVGACYIREKRS